MSGSGSVLYHRIDERCISYTSDIVDVDINVVYLTIHTVNAQRHIPGPLMFIHDFMPFTDQTSIVDKLLVIALREWRLDDMNEMESKVVRTSYYVLRTPTEV